MRQIESLQQRLDQAALSPTVDDRAVRILAIDLSIKRQQLTQIENYGDPNS